MQLQMSRESCDVAHVVLTCLAVHRSGICQCGPFVVVGKHRSAVAVTAQRLGGEKGSGGDVAETACTLVAYHAAKPLRTVLEDEKPVGIGYLTNSGIVAGRPNKSTVMMTLGVSLPSSMVRAIFRSNPSVHIERIAIHIHKNGRGPFQRDDLCRREESEVGHEYGISRTDVPYFQARVSASVPLPHEMQCFTPTYSASPASSSSRGGP